MSLGKKFRYVAAAFLMLLSTVTPMGGALLRSANAAVGDDAPANSKNIRPNGDGTYTIALSVTGATSTNSSTTCNGANVIFVLDTSQSMDGHNTTYNGRTMSRFAAEKHILTDQDGIIDQMLSKNTTTCPSLVEIALVSFGIRGSKQLDFTNNGDTLKTKINSLGYDNGTNWEEGLIYAKEYADAIKATQPNEDIYVVFMTDGEPTSSYNNYSGITLNDSNYRTRWGYAKDNARDLVEAGYNFYGIYTWGTTSSSHYLSSLVQYAYTGSGDYNTALSSQYSEYFTNATDSDAVVTALNAISNAIITNVGYTNVGMTDGVTAMTSSSVKAAAGGEVTGLKYYRSGGSYGTADPDNGNYGTEWAEAPHATINEKGEVDWNLGTMVLENGVTYTVTFVVWPKQESLDLVADLNNGKISYDSLTADQKKQISVSGGKYKLKTNTDYPTVTYSTVTTTTENGQTTTVTSDPVTVNMTNPDPVALAEEKIAVEKKWDDTMDPTQRDEVSSVKLYLKVDDEDYDFNNETEEIDGIVLTEGEDGTWTADSIAIAPGVMISNTSSPAYDSTKTFTYEGKTYSILEDGHKYVFREENINTHFELTAYEHHPMIVDGEVKSVTFEYDDDGNITGISNIYKLDTLSATNTIKGGINIEKKVVDETGATVDSKDKFTAVAHLVDKDGSDYHYDYRIYYGQNNPEYNVSERTCTDAEGNQVVETNKHRSCHIYGDGTITQELYVGDTIRVVNVDAGTRYYVEEPNTPTGYELVSVDNKISVGTPNDFGAYTDDQTVTVGDKKYYVMQGNSAWQSIITNKYTSGSLKISKTVTGNPVVAKDFEFTVKIYGADGKEIKDVPYSYTGNKTGTITSGGTVTLAGGQNITIEGLPEGATYEVTETAMPGYKTTKTGDTGTIVKNETAEAKFTNTYSTSGTIKIEAKKQFNNWLSTDSFEFVLKDSTDKTVDTQTISSSTQSAKFNVPITAAGTYVYKIEETQNFRDGIQNVTNTEGHILTVTVVAVDKGDGTLDTSNVSYGSDLDTITNEYTASGSVTFAATKMLTGRDWANQESFAFTIYGADENYNANTSVFGNGTASAANAGADGSSAITFDKIEYSFADAGKTYYYVIKETSDLTNTGLTSSGDLGAKVEITDNHDGTLSTTVIYSNGQVVTNTYAANGEVVLKATKTLTGRDWKDGESYTFVLQDAQGKAVNDADGNPIQATVSQNGEVTFPALKYTEADIETGTFNYVITETGNLAANGLSKSNDINVTVTVAVDGTDASKLNVTASYDNNDTITNTYAATGGVTLEATKKFAGATYDWSDKSFVFVLSGNGVAERKPVTEANPKATFSTINYTLADAGKTYTYTISETDAGLAGVTASDPLTVEVAVVDNGDGTLTATPSYKDNLKEITNTYATEAVDVTLHVNKKIKDDSDSNVDGTFEFTLTGNGVNQTKSITTQNLEGGVDFDTITYTEAGEYTYTLKEVAGDTAGFSYDTNEYTVVVTVTDDPETAKLSASVSYGEAGLTITNTYKATATSIQFEVTKALNGMNEGVEPVDFEFTLSDADGEIQTISIHGAGSKKFDEISYDKAGTYTYTVVEKNGGAGGYSYDSATYAITVEVKDEGGVLKATPTITKNGESASSIDFVNNYSAKGKIELQVVKELDGRNWLEGETHTFVLKDNAGKVLQSKEVSAEGKISFDEIEYTKAGPYTYTIEEVLGADYQDGSLTPADPVTVTVTVKDDGAGNLTATPSYGDTTPTMTNTYTASGSVTINVTKNLEGRDWLEGESFTFALYDSEGNQIGDAKTVTKDSATAAFTVEYTQADTEESEDGTAEITYTVKEISEMPAGIEQPEDLTVTVSLKDDGHGTIEATADQEDGYTITNEYVPTATNAQFHVEKEIDDQSNSDANGTFTFILKDGEGNTIEEKTVDTSKETGVDFTAINYTEAGTYNYTITEQKGDAAGYTYDEKSHAVVVVVTDHPDTGELTAAVTYDGEDSLTITNVYEAKPVDVIVDVEKTIYGIENVDSDKLPTFEFELTGDNVDGTMTTTITGEGEASFEAITFTKVGTYTLTVHEVEGSAPGYIYDDNDVTVTVVVTDNNGQLEAEVSYGKGLAEGLETAIFTNGYEAAIVEDYEIVVKKMLEGRKLDEGEFEFELVNTDGEVVATGTNDADGNVVFSGISFEAVGEYNFLVREIVDENRGEIDFDTNEYEVTIVVKDNGEGELVVESDTSSEVIFKNKYNEPGKGENPQTSDDILGVVATLIISAIGLIGAMFYGIRSKEEIEA